jgi:hypothetical protein
VQITGGRGTLPLRQAAVRAASLTAGHPRAADAEGPRMGGDADIRFAKAVRHGGENVTARCRASILALPPFHLQEKARAAIPRLGNGRE